MATTKIWAIKDSLSRVLQYAANPDKTVLSDLKLFCTTPKTMTRLLMKKPVLSQA